MILPILPILPLLPLLSISSFALIVTNNRSLELSRPDLRYADDDGVKYAELFDELYGADRVLLLTELDAETRALYPEWIDRVIAPTRANLDRMIDTLKDEKGEGYVVLAGHGDVAGGQGYIELADSRLSAADLEEGVIGRLGADRIHLVLDSCNSYFMLNPRKPGGKRFAASNEGARDLLERHVNVGALISTSAEAVTYEWSEVQSGIFSYELRSGLRGAADADTDGKITYEELKAFLDTANRGIANDLYRPKIFARGPDSNDASIMMSFARGSASRELELPKLGARKITVRDRLGVRVLDLHKEDGTAAILRLPVHGALGVFEEIPALAGQRPTIAFRALTSTAGARVAIDELPVMPTAIAARGEAPVFQNIFAAPFGNAALEEYRNKPASTEAPAFGVSKRDADRLGLFLRTTAEYEREGRHLGSLFSAGGALVLGGIGVHQLANDGEPLATGLALGGGVFFAGNALITALVSSESEDLLEEYSKLDLSTEARRGEAVLATERKLEEIAESYRSHRQMFGWISIGAGMLTAATTGLTVAASEDRRFGSLDYAMIGNAVILGVLGIYQLFIHEYPAERTWSLYASERDM